jgi:hypothetical protein
VICAGHVTSRPVAYRVTSSREDRNKSKTPAGDWLPDGGLRQLRKSRKRKSSLGIARTRRFGECGARKYDC